jgi:hypothetical protein
MATVAQFQTWDKHPFKKLVFCFSVSLTSIITADESLFSVLGHTVESPSTVVTTAGIPPDAHTTMTQMEGKQVAAPVLPDLPIRWFSFVDNASCMTLFLHAEMQEI